MYSKIISFPTKLCYFIHLYSRYMRNKRPKTLFGLVSMNLSVERTILKDSIRCAERKEHAHFKCTKDSTLIATHLN